MEMANEQQGSLFLQRIPCEVIAHILWLSVPAFDDYTYDIGGRDEDHLLKLGTICRSLRRLVYSTPALWATVTFQPRPSDSYDKISEWLGRAGSAQLALRIDNYWPWRTKRSWAVGGGLDGEEKAEAEHKLRVQLSILLSTIKPYLPNCRHLELRLAYIVDELAFETPSKAPLLLNLKTFNLDVWDEFARQHHRSRVGPGDSPDVAPNLEEVRLKYLPMNLVHSPWHNIVDLELDQIYTAECPRVLSQTPLLRHLALVDLLKGWSRDYFAFEDDPDAHEHSGNVVLSHLVSFDWQGGLFSRHSHLFDQLRTPSLTYFRLYPDFQAYAYALKILTPFLKQAAPSLSVIITKGVYPQNLRDYVCSVAPNATTVLLDFLKERNRLLTRPPPLDSSILSLYDRPGGRERHKVECIVHPTVDSTLVED